MSDKFDISLFGYKSAYSLVIFLFVIAYWPALGVEFRAEQWPIYRHYQDLSAPKNIDELLHIMFWTPFKDYRFLPLGYLFNYFQYSLFGNNFNHHVIYSLTIYLLNAALASKLIHQLTSHKVAALTTFSLALLMPADIEIVAWSFFTYKQYQITFLLLSLTTLVVGLKNDRNRDLIQSSLFLCISSLFYEITFPLVVIYCLAFCYLRKSKSSQLTLLSFILIYLCSNFYLQNVYFFGEMRPSYHALNHREFFDSSVWLLDTTTTSMFNWVYDGWFLANLGFKLTFDDTIKYITFNTSFYDHTFINIFIFSLWLLLLGFILFERNFLERHFVLGVFCFAIVISPLAIGRSYTNGVDYLAKFSMYNHVPNIFLSLAVGYLISSNQQASAFSKNLNLAKAVVMIPLILILTFSTNYANGSYKKANTRDSEITMLMQNVLKAGYAITVSDDFLTRLELPNTSLDNNFNQNKYALLSADFKREELASAAGTGFILDAFFFEKVVNKKLSLDEIIQLNKVHSKRLSELCIFLQQIPVATQYYTRSNDLGLPSDSCQLKLSEATSFDFYTLTYLITRELVYDYLSSHYTPKEFFEYGFGFGLPRSNARSHPAHHIENLVDGNINSTWSTIPYKSKKNVMIIVPVNRKAPVAGAELYRREIEHELFPERPKYYFLNSNGRWKKITDTRQSTSSTNHATYTWDAITTSFIGIEFPLNKRLKSHDFMSQINEIKLNYDLNRQ